MENLSWSCGASPAVSDHEVSPAAFLNLIQTPRFTYSESMGGWHLSSNRQHYEIDDSLEDY